MNCFIYPAHHFFIQMCDLIRQPLLVNGPDLLEQDDRVTIKAVSFRVDFHMSRQFGFLNLGGDRRHNNRWAKSIANVVLDDQNRAYATLLRTNDG